MSRPTVVQRHRTSAGMVVRPENSEVRSAKRRLTKSTFRDSDLFIASSRVPFTIGFAANLSSRRTWTFGRVLCSGVLRFNSVRISFRSRKVVPHFETGLASRPSNLEDLTSNFRASALCESRRFDLDRASSQLNSPKSLKVRCFRSPNLGSCLQNTRNCRALPRQLIGEGR